MINWIKNLPRPPRYQYTGFWLSMPFITFTLCYILFDERLFREWKIWLISYPLIYLIGFMSWRTHSLYDHYLRSKFPSLEQTRQRVFYKLPVNILIMTPSVLLIFYVFDAFHILGYQLQNHDLKMGLFVGLTINVVFESLWEVLYIIDKFKDVTAEREMIKQMHLQQEFVNLKQKVNPHFLFNCFNTLSSLITEDKIQAEKFLDELSKVYRYLLRNNESGISTVEQELQFINSYYKLLKTRFGQGFEMKLDIDASLRDKHLPTLSLQLLMENAVKHNIISKSQPVILKIYNTDLNEIVVENNLQKKIHPVDSTGIGLSSIREKYHLLGQLSPVIEEQDQCFIVKLPLIQN